MRLSIQRTILFDMNKTLLIIGEKKVIKGRSLDPSHNAFVYHVMRRAGKNAVILTTNYKNVLTNDLPDVLAEHILILLFFPFQFWNKNIEVYDKDSRVYGDKDFGKDFEKFFLNIQKALEKKYRDKTIEYVNPPQASVLDRDKEECKKFFHRHKIPIAKGYDVKSLKDVEHILGRGISLYVKPRFGSMGKGISYLSNGFLITNFLFQKGKVISHPYDYNWRFHEITRPSDREKFLKAMIKRGFIFEEAIDPPVHKGHRSDFRVYCVYGKVIYYYIRSTPAVSLVTNWSQGGKIEQKRSFSKYISAANLRKVESLARKVARNLQMNYAGIDMIFSKDYKKIYVLEAHSFPAYEKGFDLMDSLAKKVLTKME